MDKQYLDYGTLLASIRGRRWVYEPHVIRVPGSRAKANIFLIPGGFAVPVVFAGAESTVPVEIKNLRKISGWKQYKAEAVHPGTGKWVPVNFSEKGAVTLLNVPVQRGCAMVRITRAE